MAKPEKSQNRAVAALEAYHGKSTEGMEVDDYECLMVDMVADTIHHANDLDYDGEAVARMALMHIEDE